MSFSQLSSLAGEVSRGTYVARQIAELSGEVRSLPNG